MEELREGLLPSAIWLGGSGGADVAMAKVRVGSVVNRNRLEVVVAGRFPPPLTGQSLATERIADLLSNDMCITRIALRESRSEAGVGKGWSLPSRIAAVTAYREALEDAGDSRKVLLYGNLAGSSVGVLRDLWVASTFDRFAATMAWLHNGSTISAYGGPLGGLARHTVWSRIDAWFLPSQGLAKRFASLSGQSGIAALPYTVDKQVLFHSEEVERALSDRYARQEDGEILFLSALVRSKGALELLNAAAPWLKERKYSRLRMAGAFPDPEFREELVCCAKTLGLKVGRQFILEDEIRDRGRVKEVLRGADVLALPSYYRFEAAPVCIIEAMNAGLPIVATWHAGIPDLVVDGRNGILVKPNSTVGLTAALGRLTCRRLRRLMGEQSRDMFVRQFSPEVARSRWLAAISACCADRLSDRFGS